MEQRARRFMEEALSALATSDWERLLARTEMVLALKPNDEEAVRLRRLARRELAALAVQGAEPVELEAVRSGIERAQATNEEALAAVVQSAVELIPPPELAHRVIEAANDEFVSIDEIARLVSMDTALTARVLRVANSAEHARISRVATVRDAVVVIGARELRSLAIAGSLLADVPAGGNVLDRDNFWEFSLTAGMLADLQARVYGIGRELAFTGGVLHNIGLLALDICKPEELAAALQLRIPGKARLHDREEHVLGFTDAQLGAALAAAWHFPPLLERTIGGHGVRSDELAEHEPLTAYVVHARILARSQGMSDGAERNDPRPIPAPWSEEPLAPQLEALGGFERLHERIDAFLHP